MILRVRVLLMAIILLVSLVPLNTAFASNGASITQEIKDNSKTFDPEEVGNRLNEKGKSFFLPFNQEVTFMYILHLAFS